MTTNSSLPDLNARLAAAAASIPARQGGTANEPPLTPAEGGSGPPAGRTTSADTEFLPVALEILATPPSPVATALLLLICSGFFAALAWSYFGWLDIHAVAQGKIQPSGYSKVVQPLEPGKVVTINVENGSHVRAGDVLLELDATESTADRDAQARDLEAASAEVARRRAAITAAVGQTLLPTTIGFDDQITEFVRRREASVLAADLAQLRSTHASLKAQIHEKAATKSRLQSSIAARQKLIALTQERVGMRQEIETRGAGSRAMIIEALQQHENQLTTDANERGQILETDASIASLERKIEETVTQFIADQTQKLAEIDRKQDRLRQELVKASSKRDRTQLKAPIDGTVQQLSVTTIGQVVGSGQSVLTVVPSEGPIEVEALLANKEIGFVKQGQTAVIKVEAFPFTRYGTIEAEVVRISRDAIDERTAAGLSDAAGATRGQTGSPSAPPSASQTLVFPATLRLAKRTILVDGELIALSAGMAVTVEIKTGQRRAIDYVLAPLTEIFSDSVHER